MSTDLYKAITRAPEPGKPLVFALHGTGGTAAQIAPLVDQMVSGAGIVAPEGDVLEHGAQRFFRRTGEGVYDMDDLARRTERMAAFVAAHKAAQPDAPVYGFGYSNGANILAAVAMQMPALFDRVGLLHPLIPWEPAPTSELAGKPVLITAGRRDPICPWPMSETLITWFEAQGAAVTTELHDGGHELRPEELLALQRLLADAPQANVA